MLFARRLYSWSKLTHNSSLKIKFLGSSFYVDNLVLFILGSGGGSWTDEQLRLNGLISIIELRSGDLVDSIRTQYGDTWSPKHGGSGGDLQRIEVAEGAKIITVQGKYGNM